MHQHTAHLCAAWQPMTSQLHATQTFRGWMSAECCACDSPQLKTHLVVALPSGAMRHRVRAHLLCDLYLALGDQRPCDGGPQQVYTLIEGVCPASRDRQSAAAAPPQQCPATGMPRQSLYSWDGKSLRDSKRPWG